MKIEIIELTLFSVSETKPRLVVLACCDFIPSLALLSIDSLLIFEFSLNFFFKNPLFHFAKLKFIHFRWLYLLIILKNR